MDFLKVRVIQQWLQSAGVKDLQLFLGFVNYYRKFIKGFAYIAVLLTDLLK